MSKRVKRVPRVVMSKLVRRVMETRSVFMIDLSVIPDGYTLEEYMEKLRRGFFKHVR